MNQIAFPSYNTNSIGGYMANKNYASQSSLGNYQLRISYVPRKSASDDTNYLPLGNKGINFNSSPVEYFKAPKQGLEKQLGNKSSKSGDNNGEDILRLLGSNTYSPAGYAILIVYQPVKRDTKWLDIKEGDKNNLAHLIEQELAQLNFQVQHV